MRAVLFDLDGTLLDIDIEAFLPVYFGALGPVIARLTGSTPAEAIDAVVRSTDAMMRPHPEVTNKSAFNARFIELTGVDLDERGQVIDDFYSRTFPTLGAGITARRGAAEAVQAALASGLTVVVATNPIFPERAIRERLRWAGLADVPFSLITTYEIMHACKPDPAYFQEVARLLQVEPQECLMVGDDAELDMGAALAGMSTFFVGESGGGGADHLGTLDDLVDLLRKTAPPSA